MHLEQCSRHQVGLLGYKLDNGESIPENTITKRQWEKTVNLIKLTGVNSLTMFLVLEIENIHKQECDVTFVKLRVLLNHSFCLA